MFLAPKDLTFIGSTLELTVPHATHLHAAKLSASRTEVLSIFVFAAALSALTKISSASAWWQLALAAWGWLELAFYSLQLVRYHNLNEIKKILPDLPHIAEVQRRFMSLRHVFDIRDFVSGWFFGHRFEELKRTNVENFVAYGFYSSEMSQLEPQAQRSVRQFVDDVLETWDQSVEPGETPHLPYMTHMWEPLRVFPKPLCVHALSEGVALLHRCVLRLQGFQQLRHKGLSYWVRHPPGSAARWPGSPDGSQTSHGMPVIFVHGVGLGMVPYWGFINMLAQQENTRRPVILMDLPHVSMRVYPKGLDIDDVADALAGILAAHDFARACVVAHSYGTFVASRLCQLHPACVHATALIDPVCLMTCFPDLLHNFVYRGPKTDNLFSHVGIMDLLRYICSRDLLIAETFCRRFEWHKVMLWPQDMPARSLVVMSGHDDLVPWRLVQRQMAAAKHPAHIMVHPDMGHGGFLVSFRWQQDILARLKPMLDGI